MTTKERSFLKSFRDPDEATQTRGFILDAICQVNDIEDLEEKEKFNIIYQLCDYARLVKLLSEEKEK